MLVEATSEDHALERFRKIKDEDYYHESICEHDGDPDIEASVKFYPLHK